MRRAWILPLLLLLLSAAVAMAEDAAPEASPCAFYAAKSAELGCAKDGYLLRFGFNYCEKFHAAERGYTPAAQLVSERVRDCLVDELRRDSLLTCANVKSRAQASHVRCYVESGFCELPREDRRPFLSVVRWELLDPGFLATLVSIISRCF